MRTLRLADSARSGDYSSDLIVGNEGIAEVEINDSGWLRQTDSTADTTLAAADTSVARVEIEGRDSIWSHTSDTFTVGAQGVAVINITNGGRLENADGTGVTVVGESPGAQGEVWVNGLGSMWRSGGGILIGEEGTGLARILDRAIATSDDLLIGSEAGSNGHVEINGVGSAWHSVGMVTIGDDGVAQLTAADGGLFQAALASNIGVLGTLRLAGGRFDVPELDNQGLILGSGRIDAPIDNLAVGEIRTNFGDHLILSGALNNVGLVDLLGGELEILAGTVNDSEISARDAVIRFGDFGLDNNSGGQLAITNGTVDVFGPIDNNSGGQIVVGGWSHAIFHDVVDNSGEFVVMPGGSALLLEDLNLDAASTLSLTLGGGGATTGLASLEVAGAASLDGEIDVNLSSGFTPELGDSFQVLTSVEPISGTFDTETFPALSGGLIWDLVYGTNSLLLNIIENALAADFDKNGVVDGDDFLIWQSNLGTTSGATPNTGDANGDGAVNGDDFLIWQSEFSSGGQGTSAQTIPEPSSVLCLALMLLLAAVVRWCPMREAEVVPAPVKPGKRSNA